MDRQAGMPTLTAREGEVARLISRGLTNKEIAAQLGISDRTVGAHIQNILNKLGASNRAQIAALSAQYPTAGSLAQPPFAAPSRPLARSARAVALVGASLIVSVLLSADHPPQLNAGASISAYERGDLVFEAELLTADGQGFSPRELYGDIDASSVKFVPGSIEYSILKPGGRTGNSPVVKALPAYFVEAEISVKPGSNVTFWLNLTSSEFPTATGQHAVSITTAFEVMQMTYVASLNRGTTPFGAQVYIPGLQSGQRFQVAVLVGPPRYAVFLNGATVIDLMHGPNPVLQSPSITVFGDGQGTVRLSAFRVYSV